MLRLVVRLSLAPAFVASLFFLSGCDDSSSTPAKPASGAAAAPTEPAKAEKAVKSGPKKKLQENAPAGPNVPLGQ